MKNEQLNVLDMIGNDASWVWDQLSVSFQFVAQIKMSTDETFSLYVYYDLYDLHTHIGMPALSASELRVL